MKMEVGDEMLGFIMAVLQKGCRLNSYINIYSTKFQTLICSQIGCSAPLVFVCRKE